MYKLRHKILGWDYVFWEYNFHSGVARVIVLPDETIGFWENPCYFKIIKNPAQVTWLTCKPEKYFNGDKK